MGDSSSQSKDRQLLAVGMLREGERYRCAKSDSLRIAVREDCWTKISSWYRLSDSGTPACTDMKPLAQAVLRERADRCVWGTNWRHPGLHDWMPNDADLVDQLESWLPGDAVREPLFASNAANLYRLS